MLNSLFYVRGNKRDFNNWEAMGNPGWSYEDVLPYFRKMEDFRGQTNPFVGKVHAVGRLFTSLLCEKENGRPLMA